MAGILRFLTRVVRSLTFWLFRYIQQLLKFAYGPFRPLVFKGSRRLWSFLGPVLLPAIKMVRFLKFYIGPLIPIIFKIFHFLRSSVERVLPLQDSDENELKIVTRGQSKGLQNLGNTCYFNSAMQALCHTYILKKLLRENTYSGELTESFRDFYVKMFSEKSDLFSPAALHSFFGRECSRFDDKKQHDSHECLRHFLDTIRKEEKTQLKKKDPGNSNKTLTVVDKVFGGHLMTVYVCMTCQSPYHVFEPCLDISLPICFESSKEGGETGLNEAGEDIQMTVFGKELEFSEGETSQNSELEQIDKGKIRKRADEGYEQMENDKEEDTAEEKQEEEEEEEEAEAKEKEQTENKIAKKTEAEEDVHKGIMEHKEDNEEKKEENQYKKNGKKEMKTREEEKEDEDKKQDQEGDNGEEEVYETADKEQNEATIKEEQKDEEDSEEKEEDDALEQQHYSIKEKQDKNEKFEKEKVEGDKSDKRRKKNMVDERENHGKPCEVNEQKNNSVLVKCLKETVNNEWEVKANAKSHEQSDEDQISRSTMNISENKERSEESDRYRRAIRLLMQPLGICPNTQLSSNDEKPKSVEDCLMYFTRKEHIKDEYLCRECQGRYEGKGGKGTLLTSAMKQTMIFNPPAILTIHLKRFELKPGGSVKRTDKVTYGERLDISPYCSSMCLRNDLPSRNIRYSLYAVVVHSGSLESGHYTSYVKVKRYELAIQRFLQMEYFDRDVTREKLIEMTMNKQRSIPTSSLVDEVWYLANDSSIREVPLSEVLNQEAYLLFYERMS